MQIDRLYLQNFRLFHGVEFSFVPGLNLVVGDNGGGKTALVEGVCVAMGSWLLGIRGQDARPIRYDDIRLEPKSQRLGRIEFIEQLPVVVRAWGTVVDLDITWERSKVSVDGKTRYGQASEIRQLSEDALHQVQNKEEFTLPIISNYGSGRLYQQVRDIGRRKEQVKASQLTERKRPTRLSAYRLSLDSRIDINAFLIYFAEESYAEFQRGEKNPAFEAVKEALVSCIAGAHEIRFNAYTSEIVADMGENGLVPFSYLSDGQRTMLAMVGDLCRKVMTLNEHLGERALLKTPGVVLVDEIDLHLHPTWQRRICDDLTRTFPMIQFIATTHSPQVVGSVSKDRIIRLNDVDAWDRPWLGTKGAESNEILREVMKSADQDPKVDLLESQIKAAIDAEDLELAEAHYQEYQAITEEPTIQRMSIDALIQSERGLRE